MNVVITGASRGIGKAVAFRFAKDGHSLFLSGRSETALYNLVQEIQVHFPAITVKAMPYDLSSKAEAIALGNWVNNTAGTVDILVNNAGIFEPGSVHNEPDGALEAQMAVNLYSAYHLTRTVLPGMIARRSGHIFNLCSIASLKAYPNGGAYSISKFALYGFSKNLREELKEYGIKVTAVLPGAVLTDSWSGFDNSSRRIMEAEDIATMIAASASLSIQACVEDIVIRPQLGDL